MAFRTAARAVKILFAGPRIPDHDLGHVDIAAARRVDHSGMEVGCDVGYGAVGGFNLRDFDVLRFFHMGCELNTVFIVQGDHGGDQVGTGLPSFTSFPVAITAGRVVGGKPPADRFR